MKLVYIAEDNQLISQLYEMALKDKYTLKLFPSGEELIPACSEQIPDLVISDLMMAGKDGFMTIRELRQVAGMEQVPILVVSSLAQDGMEAMVQEMGATAFYPKTDERVQHIDQLINEYLKD